MNVKVMAMMMVGVMMFSGCVVMMDNEGASLDAVVGDGGAYSYTLAYHSDQMGNTAAQELQLTVAGMTPISHSSGSSQLTLENEGSWSFNTTTGIGPFNSFYAAFDITDGNKFVSILDPYDLTKKIDGTSLNNIADCNIMWVLPTVYWYVDNDGNLVLTNDSTSGGVAYAHTVDGNVYKYLAIGVYEGSLLDINDGLGDKLVSVTNAAPIGGISYDTFVVDSINYNLDSSLDLSNTVSAHTMLVNYYQWQLYKYCSFIVMEGFNSQQIVGNGHSTGDQYIFTTGSMNQNGPYAGTVSNTTSNVKLFIENAWGGMGEFLGGAYRVSNSALNVSTSSNQYTSNANYKEDLAIYMTAGRDYANGINQTAKAWSMATSISGASATKALCDEYRISDTSMAATVVGGYATGDAAVGISYLRVNETGGGSAFASFFGARLAMVYGDSDLNITIQDDNTGYGSISTSGSFTVPAGTTIGINSSTNALTIGSNTITVTTNADTAEYSYSFLGWYDGVTLLEDGDELTEDTTITATFSRTTNQYTATITNTTPTFGSVSPVSVTADYGSAISSASNVLTIGSTDVTATPETADAQYTYAFGAWGTFPATLTQDIEITVSFTQTINEYTITWSISGVTSTETYQYGQMPTHEDPTPPEGYLFAGWSPALAVVTQDQTYTAVFEEIVYITVTFDPNGGELEGSSTKVVGIGTPYGDLPTAKKDNNRFVGWFTEADGGDMVTSETIVTADADHTLYAHWELTGFAAMLKPLLFLFPLILLAFLAIALVRTFA